MADLNLLIKELPKSPGVYQFLDKNQTILYVGKAKKLSNRVKSYFNNKDITGKTKVLVSKINDIKYVVVETEEDALLLENSLIKEFKPKYNIQLKDDKTFPWIIIKNEPFPRVFYTRNYLKDGSQYFGPFASVYTVKTLLDLVKKLYTVRICNLNLTKENIDKGKFNVCLEYHIGNCKGPCEGYQSEENYLKDIDNIKKIIKGDIKSVLNYLEEKMKKLAEFLKFEEAAEIKEKYDVLKRYQSKSTVVSTSIDDVDVFTYLIDDNIVFINFLKIFNGAIIQVHSFTVKMYIEEEPGEIIANAILDMREKVSSSSKEIILQSNPNFNISSKVKITVPLKGDKKHLIDLSKRNLLNFKKEVIKRKNEKVEKLPYLEKLKKVKKDLNLKNIPVHIECFDNSNIQGTNPVAACVVFKNGKPSKKDYRKYKIKTVSGPDDFASMKEVIFRRYKRLLDEKQSLPQLIIIDGGKGQLGSAVEPINELGLSGKIEIISIAKKLEEIFKPGDSLPLYLNKTSDTLKLIQFARDEAHRFGISFHRDLRSKSLSVSELDSIPGIGEKTVMLLYKKFKNVDDIKNADLQILVEVIGKKKAEIVYRYFNSHSN